MPKKIDIGRLTKYTIAFLTAGATAYLLIVKHTSPEMRFWNLLTQITTTMFGGALFYQVRSRIDEIWQSILAICLVVILYVVVIIEGDAPAPLWVSGVAVITYTLLPRKEV